MNVIKKIKLLRLKKEVRKYQLLFKELYIAHLRGETPSCSALEEAKSIFQWITGYDYSELTQSFYDKMSILEGGEQASTKGRIQEVSGECQS